MGAPVSSLMNSKHLLMTLSEVRPAEMFTDEVGVMPANVLIRYLTVPEVVTAE